MRAIWTGEIAFGLVTIPVKLYSATRDLTPQFSQLHTKCGTRISMVRRCAKCCTEVPWEEVGKGYEVSKGQHALFTKEELAAIEGEDAAGGIDVAEFFDPHAVDTGYIEKTYWVGPAGVTARGFHLLRTVLELAGKVALAKVKIRTRTRLGLLRPRGRIFALDMMRFSDEMVSPNDIVVPEAKPASARELTLARELVFQLAAPFDASRHPDSYRAAVSAAVEAKVEADQVKTGAGADLSDLLTRSLNPPPAPAAASSKPGPKKTRKTRLGVTSGGAKVAGSAR